MCAHTYIYTHAYTYRKFIYLHIRINIHIYVIYIFYCAPQRQGNLEQVEVVEKSLSITFHWRSPPLRTAVKSAGWEQRLGGQGGEGLSRLLPPPHFTEEAIQEKKSTGFGITRSLV